jgi:opine dehydrogenase
MYEIVRNVKGYAIVNAPPKLDTRLLTEDVPMGLVPMTELAKLVNVKTPVMNLAIDLASALLERDFRAEGRTLERMGISGMSKEDLLEYVR